MRRTTIAAMLVAVTIAWSFAASVSPDPAAAGTAVAGDWTTPAGTAEGTRYSPLDQITRENVGTLREMWRYATGIRTGHEGQPLVVGGTMYVVTPFPNKLIAFDLTRPGPARKWEFTPRQDTAAFGKACCDRVNRGAAYAEGKIIYNLLDNHTIAVDAETGREVWRTLLGSVDSGETMTMAPLVVGDRVFVGNSGGELGVRGWLAALDVASGQELWLQPARMARPWFLDKQDAVGRRTATSGDDGSFAFADVPVGTWHLAPADRRGQNGAFTEGSAASFAQVVEIVPEILDVRADVRLTRDLAIRGRVEDAHGAPTSEATIWTHHVETKAVILTKTEPDGSFVVGPLIDGEYGIQANVNVGRSRSGATCS